MNIFEQQKSNKRYTLLLFFISIVFFLILGIGFDFFVLGVDPSHLFQNTKSFDYSHQVELIPQNLPIGTFVALLLSFIMSLCSYFLGDALVLSSSEAVRLDGKEDKDFLEKQLENIVDEMTLASGLPRPKLYLIEDSDPNAFSTGRDPKHASIAVTRGLLEKLNREEIQAVIGHEMSHIRNFDIRLMTILAALVGAMVLLSDWTKRSFFYGGRNRGSSSSSNKKGGGGAVAILFILWLVLIILSPILGQLMAMCVSRKREYLADASGAELTRNPLALSKALEKLEKESAPTQSIKQGTAHLCIVDPLGSEMGLKEGLVPDILATHPPISGRIKRLKEMAYIINK